MKKIIAFVMLVAVSLSLISCGNQDLGWGNYTYNYAYIEVKDGVYIEIEVQSWKDYGDASVEITTKEGNNFLSSYNKIIMSKERLTYLTLQNQEGTE